MPAVLKKLEDQAMRLTARSRARLAERLLASLDEEPAEPDAERLRGAEAGRRTEDRRLQAQGNSCRESAQEGACGASVTRVVFHPLQRSPTRRNFSETSLITV